VNETEISHSGHQPPPLTGGGEEERRSFHLPWPVFVLLAILGAAVFGAMVAKSTGLAVFSVLILGLLLTVVQRPLIALSLLLVLFPFSEIPFFADKLVSIPGARPALLLGVFVVGISMINLWKASRPGGLATMFSLVSMALFTFAVIRSVPYLDTLNAFWPEDDLSVSGYVLSYLVKRLIYFLPFVVVVLYAHSRKEITFVLEVLVASVVMLSLYFLYYYLFNVDNKGVIELAWEYAGDALGLHKNAAAAIYVIVFPLCLARFFVKKDFWGIAALVLSLLSIAFLYSRTAYVTAIMSWILYLVLSKRTRFLPAFFAGAVVVVLLLSTSAISESILERATSRVETGDLNKISAGRLELLWIPLAEEYVQHPVDMAIGKGRYAMLTTAAARQGFILGASHPHNMYFEQILDAGFVGLVSFLIFFLLFLRLFYRSLSSIQDPVLREYQVGTIVSVISFLAAGMTAGTFFPDLENTNIWVVLALGVVITRVSAGRNAGHA